MMRRRPPANQGRGVLPRCRAAPGRLTRTPPLAAPRRAMSGSPIIRSWEGIARPSITPFALHRPDPAMRDDARGGRGGCIRTAMPIQASGVFGIDSGRAAGQGTLAWHRVAHQTDAASASLSPACARRESGPLQFGRFGCGRRGPCRGKHVNATHRMTKCRRHDAVTGVAAVREAARAHVRARL